MRHNGRLESEKSELSRKLYMSPALTRFGSVSELTTSGSDLGTEDSGVGGGNTKTDPMV